MTLNHNILSLVSCLSIRQPLPGFMRCRHQRPHSLSSFPRSCAFSTFARPTDNKPSQRAVILRIFIPLFHRFVRFLPLAVVSPSQVVSLSPQASSLHVFSTSSGTWPRSFSSYPSKLKLTYVEQPSALQWEG